jgi:uncharacterized protein (TIGR02444 family)
MTTHKTTPPSAAHEPLWDFALRFYRLPGVEQDCLDLQDRWGADATLVLWLCWLEQREASVLKVDIEAAQQKVGAWQQQVIAPLRLLRRQIKVGWAVEDTAIQEVRRNIQGAELSAEKTALLWLEQLYVNGARGKYIKGAGLSHYLGGLAVPEVERTRLVNRLTRAGESDPEQPEN